MNPPDTDLEENPMFVNDKGYDFHLKPESPLNRGGADNVDIGGVMGRISQWMSTRPTCRTIW